LRKCAAAGKRENGGGQLKLTDRNVERLIGQGMRLRVPHDKTFWSSLEPDPSGFPPAPSQQLLLDPDFVRGFLARNLHLLHKMTEERIGDERNYRLSWKDCGMDGDVADWYVMLQ
jgi:hypothetical protein